MIDYYLKSNKYIIFTIISIFSLQYKISWLHNYQFETRVNEIAFLLHVHIIAFLNKNISKYTICI